MNVELHDGSRIDVVMEGEGPAILLPVNPVPVEGPQADEMRKWGADPALGRTLIAELSRKYRVIAFDYEGHVLQAPKPDTLTPENIAADFLRIADAAEAERFAYYGYSWLALSGLQLAIRTGLAHGTGHGRISPDRWPLRGNAESHERDASNVMVQCFRQPTERNGANGRMGRNLRGIRLVQRRSVHERKTDEAVCHALRTFAGVRRPEGPILADLSAALFCGKQGSHRIRGEVGRRHGRYRISAGSSQRRIDASGMGRADFGWARSYGRDASAACASGVAAMAGRPFIGGITSHGCPG